MTDYTDLCARLLNIGRAPNIQSEAADAIEAMQYTSASAARLRAAIMAAPWFDPVKHVARDACDVAMEQLAAQQAEIARLNDEIHAGYEDGWHALRNERDALLQHAEVMADALLLNEDHHAHGRTSNCDGCKALAEYRAWKEQQK